MDASTTASNGSSGRVSSVRVLSNPRPRTKSRVRLDRPRTWTSAPAARRNSAVKEPIAPPPSTRTRSPEPTAAAWAARQALPPGSTSAPSTGSTASGSTCSEVTGTASLSAKEPGRPPADADLLPILAGVLPTSAAASAGPVPEHGVADDPAADLGRVDPGTDLRDPAAPFVPEPDRVGGVALMQMRHLAGEELDIRAPDPARSTSTTSTGAATGIGTSSIPPSTRPGR